MIYTVTFNPSLDYYVKVNSLKSGIVNRTADERLTMGGKGLNVSLALNELGDENKAFAFVAGFTGKFIKERAISLGLNCHFINVSGQNRINVKIKSNIETDINGSGANVFQKDVDKLAHKLKALLKAGDWLIVSGSVPSTLKDSAYADLLKNLSINESVKTVIDASGNLLTETLKYKPFLIKPNIYEMCEIFGLKTVPDIEGVFAYARKFREMGARNVIVSMGSSGAAMVTETEQALYVRAARGQLINSVGAGDSLIAGFIHEFISTGSYFSALNFGAAAGSACAFTKNIATREQIASVEKIML